MKKISLYIIFTLLVYSCKKDIVTQKDIDGSWEYSTFIGYPFDYPTLPPGNGQIIIIGRNGLFERKSNDTVTLKATIPCSTKKIVVVM